MNFLSLKLIGQVAALGILLQVSQTSLFAGVVQAEKSAIEILGIADVTTRLVKSGGAYEPVMMGGTDIVSLTPENLRRFWSGQYSLTPYEKAWTFDYTISNQAGGADTTRYNYLTSGSVKAFAARISDREDRPKKFTLVLGSQSATLIKRANQNYLDGIFYALNSRPFLMQVLTSQIPDLAAGDTVAMNYEAQFPTNTSKIGTLVKMRGAGPLTLATLYAHGVALSRAHVKENYSLTYRP